ncbi:IS5 family transposase [Aeromonas caviae]|nr:IS5 family transposase [Aeromonas caviae]MDX7837254.1 IS5 family transposase [Aeromonas caviae]
MPSLQHCNCISIKKGLSTSTCGALTAPMSEHPKMLSERVKKHSGESSSWSFSWWFGSKIHLVTDGNGLPLGFCLSPGQSAEIRYATSALAMARLPTSSGRYRTRPTHLAADKAYSSRALRAELRRRKIKAVIPQRSDQQRHHKGRPLVLDKARYRRRNVVERCFGWLKKFRRFSTRYEKLAGSFAAFIKQAFCLRYLREQLVDRKPAF